MNAETNPCYKCTDRWIKDGHRCHETCERYLAWRAKFDADKQKMQDEKNRRNKKTIKHQKYYAKFGDKE